MKNTKKKKQTKIHPIESELKICAKQTNNLKRKKKVSEYKIK